MRYATYIYSYERKRKIGSTIFALGRSGASRRDASSLDECSVLRMRVYTSRVYRLSV